MKKKLLFTVFSMIVLFSYSQLPSYLPQNGLVAWYPFNGNANDESGNGNNGAVTGATLTTDRNGNQNAAYYFDPNITSEIFIDTQSITGTELINNFSVMMWVKANRTVNMVSESTACPGTVTVPMANSNQNWALWPASAGSNLGFGFSIGTNGVMVSNHGTNILINRAGYAFNKTDFSLVVITHINDSVFLYVDGVLVNTKTDYCLSVTKLLPGILTLGAALYSPNFSGVIDDFGVWNRALTSEEVSLLYYENSTLITYVPDDNFEQALIDLGYDDNLDNYVITSNIEGLTQLNLASKSISDLTGIEDFVSLTWLDCSFNNLTSLDIASLPNLQSLYCTDNQLTGLDLSNNNLLYNFNCYNNQLSTLDVSNNTNLYNFNCYNNQLSTLDVSNNSSLVVLDCNNNQLSSLDVINNTNLQSLNFDDNQITSIDVSNLTVLNHFRCKNNGLTTLDVSNCSTLSYLNSQGNSLTCIQVNQWQIDNVINSWEKDLGTAYSLDCSSETTYCKKIALFYLRDINGKHLEMEVNTDTWHYLAFTKASDLTGKLYLDGNLIASGNFDNLSYNYSQLYLGVDFFTTWTSFYKGWIDDFRVSNKVRSDSEILANYQSNSPLTVDGNTLGLWHFDEVSGNTYLNSASGLSGDFFNGVKFETGKYGNSAYFDGIDDRGNCKINIPESNITFEIWIKMDGIEAGGTIFQAYGAYSTNALIFDNCESTNLLTFVPDNNFEQALIDLGYDDVLDDYVITSNISNVTELYISSNNIVDLTGIEDFLALEILSCENNQINSLDLSNNTALTSLICSFNQLTSLDLTNNPALSYLECDVNYINDLNLSNNTALTWLMCTGNQLTGLDITNNTALTNLYCFENYFTSLDLSNNIALTTLECTRNPYLSCIQVNQTQFDNIPIDWEKDSEAIYAIDCNGPNYLLVESSDAYLEITNNINVQLESSETIKGFQFDIEFPSGFVFDPADISNTNLPQNFQVYASDQGNNIFRIIGFSLSNETIDPGTTSILTFPTYIDVNTALGDYILPITNVILSDINNNDISSTVLTFGTITLKSNPIGDANLDGSVNILDILVEIDYIFGYDPSPFNFILADINSDGVINILDVLETQDIILSPTSRKSQNKNNSIYSKNLSGNNYLVVTSQSANANEATNIDIEMNNDDVVKGMEFDLVLPAGFTFNPADITSTSRLSGFIVSSSEVSANTYKVLVFSLSSATISVGTGAILNLPVFIESSVSDGVYPLAFTNVVISNTSNTDISTVAPVIGEITIGTLGLDDLKNSENEFTLYPNPTSNRFYFKSNTSIDTVEIYDINGRTILKAKYNENGIDIESLSNGMYFVKGYINNSSKIFKLIKK